ncbi:olfactory receptor 6N2-like [Nematolebias whitei]|uniref:olfactory receptor 6N2-like n=1 Tax=Nematolebias whitei TaxID=451745 RepID=UPI00189B4429|nr:olfactory receptor 6N2-like [Nematolebias whitei]
MENVINISYITLCGYVDMNKYRFLYFTIMFAVYILIICSNSIIVYLIWINKSLHDPMYIFIAALLINSVLVSTGVYPKLLIDFLSEKQTISYPACLFQIFVFYSLSGSEFLLLAAMAFDRYVSICKPLQYHTIMRKTTVCIFLVSAWLIPFCHLAVPIIGNANQKLCSFTLKGIFCNNVVYYILCVSSRALLIFGLVILFNISFLPMFFIIFTYTVILIISYRSCREVRKKAAQTCLPHLLVLMNYFFLLTFDTIVVRLDADISKIARFVMILQVITYNPICNPIIYGLKMKEIYKHTKNILAQQQELGNMIHNIGQQLSTLAGAARGPSPVSQPEPLSVPMTPCTREPDVRPSEFFEGDSKMFGGFLLQCDLAFSQAPTRRSSTPKRETQILALAPQGDSLSLQQHTLLLTKRHFWWPNMDKDIKGSLKFLSPLFSITSVGVAGFGARPEQPSSVLLTRTESLLIDTVPLLPGTKWVRSSASSCFLGSLLAPWLLWSSEPAHRHYPLKAQHWTPPSDTICN